MKVVRETSKHLQGPAAAAVVFIEAAKGLPMEKSWALFLSENREVLGGGLFETSEGNEFSVSVPLEELGETAKALGAKFAVLAHNHPQVPNAPDGVVSAQPSLGDLMVHYSVQREFAKHDVLLSADFVIGPHGDTVDIVQLLDTVEMSKSPLAGFFAHMEAADAERFSKGMK